MERYWIPSVPESALFGTKLADRFFQIRTGGDVPFPDALRGKYQCYTQADLTHLRASGCDHAFADVQSGVTQYMATLSQ